MGGVEAQDMCREKLMWRVPFGRQKMFYSRNHWDLASFRVLGQNLKGDLTVSQGIKNLLKFRKTPRIDAVNADAFDFP